MALTTNRIDGQNIGLRFTAPDVSAPLLSVDLSTAAVSSAYLSESDKQVIRATMLELFALVPLAERLTGALGFVQRLVSVAAADNSTVTPTVGVVGNTATLTVTVGAAPANLVLHIPYTSEGLVAWASGIGGSGGGAGVATVSGAAPIASSGGANPTISLTGVVPVANGGTGLSTVPANGQLLIGNGVDFTETTLTAGTAIGVTNGPGSITIASTAVTSVAGAAPVTSTGGTAPVIGLANSGVGAGIYGDSTHVAQVTVDVHGIVTNAANTAIAFPIATVSGAAPVAVSAGANPTVSLNDSGVAAGVHGSSTTVPVVTLTAKGIVSSVTDTAIAFPVTSVGASGSLASSGGATPSISITPSGVVAGPHGSATVVPVVTVNAEGLVTGVVDTPITFPAAVTSVSVNAPLTSTGGLTPTLGLGTGTGLAVGGGNLNLADTAVAPASYGNAAAVPESKMPQFTVDQQGRLTAASESAIQIGGSTAKLYVDTQDAATLASANAYAQSLSFTISSKVAAHAATTAALPAYTVDITKKILTANVNGALPLIDGQTLLVTERLLVKDEAGANAPNNGIYVVTQVGDGGNPWILTRASDADSAAELCGSLIPVATGTVNAGTVWIFAANSNTFVLGTTDVLWTQLSVSAATTSTLGTVQLAGALGGAGTTAASPKLDVSLANVTSGTLDVTHGGTGLSAVTTGDLLVASAPNTLSALAGGASGTVLKGQGAGVAPAFGAVSLTADVSGTLPIGNGGTGLSGAPAAGALLVGDGAAYQQLVGTAGAGVSITPGPGTLTIANTGVLTVGAAGVLSSSGGQNPSISLTGVVGTANGGTGLDTSAAANGKLLIGNGAGLSLANLTAGANISITNGAGSVTVDATGVVTSVAASSPLASSGGATPTISLASAVPVSKGGTGLTTAPTAGQFLVGNGLGGYSQLTGTAGTGISITPGIGTITIANTGVTSVAASSPLSSSGGATPTISFTGVLDISKGGTGNSATPTNGQLLIGNGTGFSESTLTAGTAIGITNGAGSITIDNNGVTSLVAGTGISLSGATGAVTVTNTLDGLDFWTDSESGAGVNATVPVDVFTVKNAATDVDAAICAKGAGATLAQIPDGLTVGGDKRGQYATDWQKSRSNSNQVASGDYSTVSGGRSNKATGPDATVVGGFNNTASGDRSVAGGVSNTASGQASVALGGQNNVSGTYSAAVGFNNTVSGNTSAAYGYNATASGPNSIAMQGGNASADTAIAISGAASANYSAAIGIGSSASGIGAAALGGQNANAAGYWAASLGGYGNVAPSAYEVGLGYQSYNFGGTFNSYVNTDVAVGYGNGGSGNAFTFLKNGALALGRGTAKPKDQLDVNGNARLTGALIQDGFTSGAAISAGQVCYLAADGFIYPAQANSSTTSTVVGVAVETVGGAGSTIALATFHKTGGFAGLTTGTEYFLSSTSAGAVVTYATLSAVSGVEIVSLGYARSATEIQLSIQRRGTTP